jgi:predicted extracellular nuclease
MNVLNSINTLNDTTKNKMYFAILKFAIIIIFQFGLVYTISAQKIIIGFYNCENFYDTNNQINVIDEEFLPNSSKEYNAEKFKSKTNRISKIILALGNLEHPENKTGVAFMGLAEIENRSVLNSIVNHPTLLKYHYKVIHFDSKDPRGIDVGFIYNPQIFNPIQYRPYSINTKTHAKDYPTRDILFIKGIIQNELINVLVNHWPSRRGNSKLARQRRIWAGEICTQIIDSIHKAYPAEKFVMMGDFNDNPIDKSLKNIPLYNPFQSLFKSGVGTLAYKDAWNLFDQILISPSLKNENNPLIYYKSVIYSNSDMIEGTGRYRGYPKRTWNGDQFNNGYSDHFPVAVIFSLKSTENPLK